MTYDSTKCVWTNGKALARLMQSERQAHAKSGFFFDYEHGETASFAKYCPKLETYAGHMMAASRASGRPVRVFCNMNGQIACSLV